MTLARSALPATLALLLLTVACAPAPAAPPSPEPDALATAVAATVTALAAAPAPPAETSPPAPPAATATEPSSPPTSPPAAGFRLAYVDAGDVWYLEEGGAPRRLTDLGEVVDLRLSDDGQRVAFVRQPPPDPRGAELWAVNTDGSEQRMLLSQADFDSLYDLGDFAHIVPSQIEFVPGTHRLLFNTQGTFAGPGLAKSDDLYALDTDTGVLSRLLDPGQGGNFALSPDGRSVALVRPTALGLVAVDGSNLRPDLVTFPSVITYSEFLFYPPVVWKPDSSAFGAVIPSEDPLAPDAYGEAWLVPADGSPPVRLARVNGDLYFPQLGGRSLLSPDLARLAFLRPTTTPNISALLLAASDGSGETVYTTGSLTWLGWGPDSHHFAYLENRVLVVAAVGEAAAPLGPAVDARWLGATELLVLSGQRGAWTLSRATVGSAPTPLLSPAGDFVPYDFVP